MKVLALTDFAVSGADRQIDPLFKGLRRGLTQITLRNGAVLNRHTAPVPITIHCLSGSGILTAWDAAKDAARVDHLHTLELSPGTLVTLEPDEPHEITAMPAVSFLLNRFTGDPE